MWCESSVRGTLISEIHPGGLCPASSVSVQTLNFLTKTTRITAQPFSVCLFSLHLPPFNALAFYISPHITTIFITQKHSTLCESLHLRHKVKITQKCLFPDLKMNNAAHTHTHSSLTIIVCTFRRVCETINKWRSDYECDAQMLFWCHFEKWNQWEPWQMR